MLYMYEQQFICTYALLLLEPKLQLIVNTINCGFENLPLANALA